MDNALKVQRWSELQISEHPGVYVDLYSGLGATIWLLNSGKFAVQNFVEFCSFVEALVLFPRLYVSPNPCPTDGRALLDVDEFTRTLASAGALNFVETPQMPSADDKDLSGTEKTFRNRFSKMRATLRSQRRAEIVETISRGWNRKEQEYAQFRAQNDQAYFLYFFTRLEDHITNQADLVIDRGMSLRSWKRRSPWRELHSLRTYKRLGLMSRVALLTEPGRRDYSIVKDYYTDRNIIAHGGTATISMPTVISEMKRLRNALRA